MANSQVLYPNIVLIETAASIGVGYSLVGTIVNASRIICFDNGTDSDVMISFDGFNDHFPVFSQTGKVLDCTTNRLENDVGWYVTSGQQIWVRKLGTPTTGDLYVSSFYGKI